MTRPPNPWAGTSPEAIWQNRLLNHVQSIRIIQGVGYRLKPSSNGTVLVLDTTKGGGTSFVPHKIVSFDADFINCHSWDGTTEGTDIIKIAKPTKLRSSIVTETIDGTVWNYSSYDDTKQTRSAQGGTDSQTQIITPRYLVGDVIYAMSAKTFVPDPDTTSDIKTMDMNIDARSWRTTDQNLQTLHYKDPLNACSRMKLQYVGTAPVADP